MPLTYVFGPLTAAQMPWLDTDFNEVGLLGTLPCSCSGTNALTLTPLSAVPQPALILQAQVRVSTTAVATNTTGVTANVSGLGALTVYKDTSSGPAVLTGSEIVTGNLFTLTYDAALNSGAGGWHLGTTPAASLGTVTSVATGTGLTGGPITTTGTISLATTANLNMLANISGSTAAPSGHTLSAVIDAAIDNTQGDILYRGASLWTNLGAGTAGAFLQTQGAAANPQWAGGVVTGIAAAGSTQGTATALTGSWNQLTTVGSGTGVILAATLGVPQTIFNEGANTVKVYPPSGAEIDALGSNVAATIVTTSKNTFVMVSATQGYTVS
jgi:hypothetical protein